MDQRAAATLTVPRQQPVHLPNTDCQYGRPRHHIPPTGYNLGQHFNPLQLPSTHRHQAHAFQTFQLGRGVTFLLGRTCTVHNMCYRT